MSVLFKDSSCYFDVLYYIKHDMIVLHVLYVKIVNDVRYALFASDMIIIRMARCVIFVGGYMVWLEHLTKCVLEHEINLLNKKNTS